MEEERAGTPNKFIVLRKEALDDKDLNIYEKFVYARICTFDVYFESSQACADFLGISKSHVEKAKRVLEKAGYIKCIANTGRGKQYQAVYDLPKWKTRPSKMDRSDMPKLEDIEGEIEKDKSIIDNKLSIIGESAEHGNPDINEMFGLWEKQFGFAQKQSAENRRACYNLLRRKDLGKNKLAKVIQLLAEAQTDRFLPKEVRSIVGFATLQANLPNLLMWARRKYAQTQTQTGVEI